MLPNLHPIFFDHLPAWASAAILAMPAAVHAVLAESGLATPDWVGSVTQVSAFGLVAWIVFFMFTRWLPNIQAAHASQMAEQRTAHMEAVKLIAEAHAEAVQAASKSHSEAVLAMTNAFKESLQSQRVDLLAIRAVCRAPITDIKGTS